MSLETDIIFFWPKIFMKICMSYQPRQENQYHHDPTIVFEKQGFSI